MYVHTFRDGTWTEGDYAGYVMYGAGTLTVDFSAVDDHIESEILDTKRGGLDVLSEMSKDRNIYFVDNQSGSLHVFRNHSDVGTLANIVYSYNPADAQLAQVSRLRGEGLYAVEVVDYHLMRELGNIFAIFNSKMADDIDSSVQTAERQLEEIKSFSEQISIIGAVDWRLEAGDAATFQLPEGNEKHIIEQISFVTELNESGEALKIEASMNVRRHYDEL